jgi:hypothetical protein
MEFRNLAIVVIRNAGQRIERELVEVVDVRQALGAQVKGDGEATSPERGFLSIGTLPPTGTLLPAPCIIAGVVMITIVILSALVTKCRCEYRRCPILAKYS